MTADVAIVGGGIIGAACAFECARAGLTVTIVERDSPLTGATAAATGHVVVMDDSEAQFALTRYSRDLWDHLAPELSPGVERSPCGTLWIAADENEMREVHRKHAFYSPRGVPTQVLNPAQLAEAEPNLRPGLAGALLVSGDSVVSPLAATRDLLAKAQAAIVTAQVASILDREIRLRDGSTLNAAAIVNAAGIHAGVLTPKFPLPIQPRKGHLLITTPHPGFIRHQLVELAYLKSAHSTNADSVAFNLQPKLNGQIVIGSSRQFGVNHSEIDPHILAAMLHRAAEYMPGIAHLPSLRSWTGFRAATPDNLPLIGPYPGLPHVFLAAGHEGLGITTSLATGRLIADQIIGRVSDIPTEPYLPERIFQGDHSR